MTKYMGRRLSSSKKMIQAVNTIIDISEHKRIQMKLARQVAALERLHELSAFLVSSPSLEAGLQRIMDILADLHKAQFGLLSLWDPKSNHLHTAAHFGFDEKSACCFTNYKPLPDAGACGVAFHTKARKIVKDTEKDSCFATYLNFARRAGFRAVHSTPILTRDGEILGVLSVHFDRPRTPTELEIQVADMCARYAAHLLEAEKSQKALRESERLYRAIGESINYGVWVCDTEGKNSYVTESFLKMLGVSQEECAGFGCHYLLHPNEIEKTLADWKRCVRSGQNWGREHLYRGANGEWHPVLSRGVPVRDDEGNITCYAGINLDIRELKQKEEALRESDRRKDEFLATLAHELRNPLAPLRNALKVLQTDKVSPEVSAKALALMERQINQMVRLVDDLMDLSRITRDRIDLRQDCILLADVIESAMEVSRPLIDELAHMVSIDLPEDAIYLRGDLIRLSQIFANLLNNAAKYTPRGGFIQVKAQKDKQDVVIRVRDNGIGIEPEMIPCIFDMFSQIDTSLDRAQGGLGIGLTLVQKLLSMHGGHIEAESRGTGKGSVFTVRLPIAAYKPDEVRIAANINHNITSLQRSLRILVVDDNEASAQTMGWMLELLGHDVNVVFSGQRALAKVQSFVPHIVLLDIGLPGMNGYVVCRAMKQMPTLKNTIFVAQTGWGQEEHRRLSKEAGFDLHLVKPVEISTLEQLLQSVAQKPELLKMA